MFDRAVPAASFIARLYLHLFTRSRFCLFHPSSPRWLALFAIMCAASPCEASFIVFSGNNPQANEEIVNFNNGDVGMTISGLSNQSDTVVTFTSPSQFLAVPSSGNARIEARALNDIDSSQVAISDSITVALSNSNLRFEDLIFNAAIVGNLGDGGSLTIDIVGFNADDTPAAATITLDDNSDPLTLGNGSNFFTVLATDGMLMTSVEISTNADTSYADLRQVRISGVVPEPASAAMLMVVAVAVLSHIGRRLR